MAIIHKFGRATVGTSYTPVCVSGFYRMPTSATALEVLSDNINDTAAGTGGQEVTLNGISDVWTKSRQVIELNGTTPVNIPKNLRRIYRCFVSRSGTYADQTGNSHAGTITIREQGAGVTWTEIDATDIGRSQSQIGMYTISDGVEAYVNSLLIHVDTNQNASIMFIKRENAGDTTTPFDGVFRTQLEFVGVANNTLIKPTEPFGPFPARTDIGCLAKVSVGTGSVSVDFEIEEFSTSESS